MMAADTRTRIKMLFDGVGNYYNVNKKASYERHNTRCINGYYRLCADPSRVVHVRADPEKSSDQGTVVSARILDYKRMMHYRIDIGVNPGYEDASVDRRFPEIPETEIPYDPQALMKMLEASIPELSW